MKDVRFEIAVNMINGLRLLLEEIGIHIPAMTLCVHAIDDESADVTHVICEDTPLGNVFRKSLAQILLDQGGEPTKDKSCSSVQNTERHYKN